MSSVIISGDTSGAITVAAPAVSGTNTLTLQAATATNAVNKLETALAYNWNGLTTNTSLDFTSLPSWIKKITVMFSAVSTTGTVVPLIQIGSGSFTSSGYISTSMYMNTAGAVSNVQYTTGFGINQNVAAGAIYGAFTLSLVNSATNAWVLNGGAANSSTAAAINISSGGVSLGGTLDRVRITTLTSVDFFDAGSVNLLLEG
jgi:hypothetical protein